MKGKGDTSLYRTGRFAETAGVTKRTLRYYDRIGLLTPSGISDSGQRLYASEDFIRLQQIVTLKYVGFSLEQIKSIMEMEDVIQLPALLSMQREWLEDKVRNMQSAIQAIKEAERVIENGNEGSVEKIQTIIGVIEMEANRDWEHELLEAVIQGREDKAKTILAANKHLSVSSIYVAAALGEVDNVRSLLAIDSLLARKPGGPEQWEPLLYMSFSCFLKHREYSDRFEQTARLLLEHGADPNAFCLQKNDVYGRTLSVLYGAIGAAGNVPVAKVLLEAGADPNDGESLYHAVEWPTLDGLELLHQYGGDIGATPAIFFHKLDFDDEPGVKWFLEHGSDPNQIFGDYGTTLHFAVYRGRSAAIIELLLKYGADVDARRSDGKTAYMLAVRYGVTEIVDLLSKHGATTEVDDTDRLFGAYAEVNEGTVRSILERKPSLLASLSEQDRMMIIEYAELNKADTVKLMLESGFDSSVRKEPGTALHFAAWHGNVETVQVLIEHGASMTEINAYGGTALGSAIHGSIHRINPRPGVHAKVVEALIKSGAVVPEVAAGSKEVNEVLCKYGARY
ncbi:ankyrin repeat domain-containing protein [Paenibacillus sp. OV219]|uniref:ankyrin repeat domain-containing protein n=1 Tax=Paenibacillus sp. OV219 TaxID=1884377 RepID=UPI0008BC238D|nr:ankyrin repeat domain-containing protein [Paenibacillus sp. OV219]SEO29939.1 DNA-binding transcriptional regulator, MerR family [Paenibacillus sp. OV219]